MKKNSKDIMHVIERYNRYNELRFECRCSGKNPKTHKNMVYVKTFPVPDELKSNQEIADYRLAVQINFKKEVEILSLGIAGTKRNINFIDFAKKQINI